ncbi:PAS domain S-box protein [Natrinema salifodinae]|uniref:histidine kinase n=1 Tax=Natrinema salifodinae TaxID=1202768 RepID=A0A1I0QJE3_9EURY|nr:PAS domain S-box protein [Natrinema salifodinae]SEW27312.1 PAS domain S-box-containing protein [Natrinema salifodinae]
MIIPATPDGTASAPARRTWWSVAVPFGSLGSVLVLAVAVSVAITVADPALKPAAFAAVELGSLSGLGSVEPGLGPGVCLILVGLAANRDPGWSDDIERLAQKLRAFAVDVDVDGEGEFASRRAGGENGADSAPGTAGGLEDRDLSRDGAAVDFALDRDDELGRLSDAIDDLATAVCERERRRAESDRYRRELSRITSDPNCTDEAKLRRLLDLGCERLDIETGIVSRIDADADRYAIETAVGRAADWEGRTMDLSAMYCRETIASGDVLGIHDAAEPSRDDRPAVDDLEIECYVGGTILLEDGPYGTVCFLNREPRSRPFTPAETSFVDLLARWVSGTVERRRYVQTIQERERRLERAQAFTDEMLDAVDDVAYLLDEDGDVQRWNESLVAVTGYADAEIESMTAPDFFDEADRPAIRDSIAAAFETGETRVEAEMRTKSGDSIPYEFIASVVEDPDGTPVEVGIGRDISDRTETERQLREREARLERTTYLLEQSQRLANVGAWELDVTEDPFVLQWTAEVRRILGLSPDDPIDLERALEYYHPEDRPRIREAVDRAISDGEPYDLELRTITEDGELRWVRTMGEPVRGDDGEIAALRGSVQDVTERTERERELERAETIIQALDELVYTIDAEGRFSFVNDALTPITGYEPEELIGEHVSTVMAEADLETARERIRELLHADELSRTFEMDLATKAGDVIVAENHMALLPMPDGEFAGTAGVIRDITERKDRERELERTTELLEQAERIAGIGGWELDVSVDPPDVTLTDGLRRLYDLPLDVDIDSDLASSFPHPDDAAEVHAAVDRALADGEGYELEHRMVTTEGAERWVRSIGEPIRADGDADAEIGRGNGDGDLRTEPDTGEIVGIRGTIQDITEHKERELALESLHGAARDLLGTDTERETAELVVETADEILAAAGVAVYGLDAEVNRLEPVAYTDGFATLCDGAPSVAVGDAESVLWNAYVTGAGTVVDDPSSFDRSRAFGPDVESGVVVPIGDHGIFAVASGIGAIDAEARRLIETLVATTEAAFDRLESEASLREREAELEERNRRLNRQISITELLRRIDRSLIGADSRAEIERTVPERLVEAETVAFAWLGTVDASGTRLEPRAWAGTGAEYLDDVPLEYDASAEPSVRTARIESPTVVSNVVEGLQSDAWRRQALDRGFQSVISVPLTYEEYSYGVLTVYADEPDAFGDLERTVVTELGERIANAINAAKTREALHAETLLELTLRIEDSTDLLSRIAAETGARVEYEGLGTHSADETLLFFETSGAPPADVRAALDDLVSVRDYRLVSEAEGICRFKATVAGEVVASRLVRHGGSPRSMRADGDGLELTVDVPTGTDVREFVEMLAEQYASVELRARRHVEHSVATRSELVTSLFDALTDRQLEVLRTAYFAGFFAWPRESTGEEIAAMLGVTQPTINRHLRISQQRLLAQLFEDEVPALAE